MASLAKITGVALASALFAPALFASGAMAQDADLVARGAYLATAADCAACHTAPKGGAPYAGGYAIASPMGEIWSTNITPSKQFGIGNWTEEQFARAVREGVAPGGHLYPAMPYDSYAQITDEDIKALYAYFQQGVAPVDEAPKGRTNLAFPFNQRALMAGWNLLNLSHERFAPKPGESAEVARGRYLSDGLAHCSTCHTPRDATMAMDTSRYLAGGTVGGWDAPNLTPDKVAGLGGWTDAEIAQYLQDGHVPGKGVAAGPMAEAVELSLSKLTDADIAAITAYLRSLPAIADPVQTAAADGFGTPVDHPYGFDGAEARAVLNAAVAGRAGLSDIYADATRGNFAGITDGAVLYDAACASCHQPSGGGTSDGYYPSLYHSTATGAARPNNLVMTMLEGVHRKGANGPTLMPGFAHDMDDAQIAAVSDYVAKTFGNPALTITAATVAELRAGGPVPLIAKAGPWLVIVPAVVGLLIVLALVAFLLRRRKTAAI